MVTRANDSTAVTTVHSTLSTIDKSNHSKLCEVHPVVKQDKLIPGHRKIEDATEKSNSGHRKIEDAAEKSNSGHRKVDQYHLRRHIVRILCSVQKNDSSVWIAVAANISVMMSLLLQYYLLYRTKISLRKMGKLFHLLFTAKQIIKQSNWQTAPRNQ